MLNYNFEGIEFIVERNEEDGYDIFFDNMFKQYIDSTKSLSEAEDIMYDIAYECQL